MFIRTSQLEERQYQQGRRDGFMQTVSVTRQSFEPAYAAGVRAGMVEKLINGEPAHV